MENSTGIADKVIAILKDIMIAGIFTLTSSLGFYMLFYPSEIPSWEKNE